MPKDKKEYKVGSLVKIKFPKGTYCVNYGNGCIEKVGRVWNVDESDKYKYRIEFEEEVCEGDDRCYYNENELTTPTQKEEDRYWLMIFKNV